MFDAALLPLMTPEELAELDQILTPPVWEPLTGPQTGAFESTADVTGYGGSAGGGKTDVLLGLAILNHRRSIIFRREAVQLKAVVDRAREILGAVGRFNENTGVWRDLPGGRQLEFGGVKDLGDEQRFRGRPHDFIGFDEADQFLERQVRFLMGWLRTTTAGQRCRVVICFNPPATAEGRWLLAYFAPWVDPKHPNPARAGELRWYATLPDGKEVPRPDGNPFVHNEETILPRSRTFIPARVTDNPYLLSTGYVATLQALPEPLRSQLLYGDMTAGLEDDPWQVIPTAWVQAAQTRWKMKRVEGIPLTALGVDVAYGGDDQTVLARRYRTWFAPLEKHPGRTTPDGQSTAALVLKALTQRNNESRDRLATVLIDAIGYGASAYDQLKGKVRMLTPVVFSEGTGKTDRTGVLYFVNTRALAWWSLRESLDPETGDGLELPPDPELLADLTAPLWTMQSNGIKIESKQDIKVRIGRSPDCGDAVVLANMQTRSVTAAPGMLGGGLVMPRG